MYYFTITHRIPYDIIEYKTNEYFATYNAMETYINEVFNDIYADPDFCFISEKGEAEWMKTGVLRPGKVIWKEER